MVIVVATINDDDGTIAQARRITRIKETNRATIGFLEINLKEMVNPNDTSAEIQRYILTVVHETFHILAFNTSLNAREILK